MNTIVWPCSWLEQSKASEMTLNRHAYRCMRATNTCIHAYGIRVYMRARTELCSNNTHQTFQAYKQEGTVSLSVCGCVVLCSVGLVFHDASDLFRCVYLVCRFVSLQSLNSLTYVAGLVWFLFGLVRELADVGCFVAFRGTRVGVSVRVVVVCGRARLQHMYCMSLIAVCVCVCVS